MSDERSVNRGSHGWEEISRERKREIITAIASGSATRGPAHIELDLTDRCNIDCYFCNQQDVRTKEQLSVGKVRDVVDELVGTGLKSVRLSGGGDPLFHREILDVLDHLSARGVVVDNLTTNAVALNDDVARRLVAGEAREVLVSLNAVDPADYDRMMQVRPALFNQVLENVRNLLAVRGDRVRPSVAIQFLIDRENVARIGEMYTLGRSLGADRVAINAVLEIPNARISSELLLTPADVEAVRPHIEEVVRRDADSRLLQMYFPWSEWNAVLTRAYEEAGYAATNLFPVAPSFKEENGGCFFGWYTATVTGTGDMYPCCLLISPTFQPLANINAGRVADQWNGERFARMRTEMREVLLARGELRHAPEEFQILPRQCVDPGLCWLKNIHFRGDEEFYLELDVALEAARRQEQARFGFRRLKHAVRQFVAGRPRLNRAWDSLRDGSRPARLWLKRRAGWNITEAP